MSEWLPQLIWRLSWFSPARWVRQWLGQFVLPHLPAMAPVTRAEGVLILMRLFAGSYLLMLGCLAIKNTNWLSIARSQCEFWAAQHPNFIVQDVLNLIIIPNMRTFAMGWALSHCWAGLAILSGLLIGPAVLLLLALHGGVIIAALPYDQTTALTHLPVLFTLPLLTLGHLGKHWGLDYWITPSDQLIEIGLPTPNQRGPISPTRKRRHNSSKRVPLKPTPDLDDDDDELDLSFLMAGNNDDDE